MTPPHTMLARQGLWRSRGKPRAEPAVATLRPQPRGSHQDAVLWAQGLTRSFSSGKTSFTLIIEEVVLTRGAQVAVVGPSGCGKSTLFGLLSMALQPDYHQRLIVDGIDAASLWQQGRIDRLTDLRSRTIGFVPQTACLLPFLTLEQNIALPQQILGRPDRELIRSLARVLDIHDLLRRRPADVSVGERQRAAVARALAHRPRMVLADEPTASVHPAQADEILELLSVNARDLGTALMITTHDKDRAAAAGFAIAPCRPDRNRATTHFAWPVPAGPCAEPRDSDQAAVA